MGENQYHVDANTLRSSVENEILKQPKQNQNRVKVLLSIKFILFLFLLISLIVMFSEPGSFEYAIRKTLIYFQTGEVID